METPENIVERVLTTWPYQEAPETWVSHLFALLSEPHVSRVFIDSSTQGGGQLSFLWDGLILNGPQLSDEHFSALIDAIQSRLKLQSSDSLPSKGGILWQGDKAFVFEILSTHKGISVNVHVQGVSVVPQHLNDWPPHAAEVVEKMRRHPNGLMVFCHRAYSTEPGAMFRVFNIMQAESKGGARFGCISESLNTLPLQDGVIPICVTSARESWEQALHSLIAQDVVVCAMTGRDEEETTAQAVLMALEDRSVLVNVSLLTVTDTLHWLFSGLRIDALRVAQVLLGIVGTYTSFRQVCSHCREPYQPDESSFAVLRSQGVEVSSDDVWMHGTGCEKCNGLGFTPSKWRIAEAIYIDRELAQFCASCPSRERLVSVLTQRGFRTYFEQMMDYARQGDVTLGEAIRVGLARRADL